MNNKAQAACCTDFLVNRSDFTQQEFRHVDSTAELNAGEIRLAVDTFAMTANNITYAAVGDNVGYWRFFPSGDGQLGRVPVWGFANVVESRMADIETGERIYGFLPMSTEFVARPVSVTGGGFVDGMEHRKDLHLIYNQYTRVIGDPAYDATREGQQMILRPLFMTSFLIEDFLREHDYYRADRLILTSASSKTAIGIASQVAHSDRRPSELIALTSERNREFVQSLGLYDAVLSYDEIGSMQSNCPALIVDMAGNSDVLRRLYKRLGDQLKYCCLVGASHWDATARPSTDLQPKPVWFFAPAQFQKRAGEIGMGGVMRQFAADWNRFIASTDDWMTIVELRGEIAIQQTFNQLLEGSVAPSHAYVLSY